MPDGNASRAPLIKLIRWWFGKTEEERQSFLQDPTISERARQDIPTVVNYSHQHSYFVACETNLEVFPLPSLSPVSQKISQRQGFGVLLPCAIHHSERSCGGRYLTASQREEQCESARRLFEEICARTAVALGDYSLHVHPAPSLLQSDHVWRRGVAHVLVEALVEASLAALYRLGLSDALEAIENNRAQAGRASCLGKHELSAGGILGPKPVGVCRAEAHSCLGVWMLLLPHLQQGEEQSPLPLTTSNSMRSEKLSQEVDVVNSSQSLSETTRVNSWQMLRKFISPSSSNVFGNESHAEKNDNVSVMVPHSGPSITITEADMRFGIAKALRNCRRESI